MKDRMSENVSTHKISVLVFIIQFDLIYIKFHTCYECYSMHILMAAPTSTIECTFDR